MKELVKFLAVALLALLVLEKPSRAQVIGSYDNFDCFNDTGETAEGFEIDVEDVQPADLTREFPSNFSTTPWVIRYGLPTVTSYDYTISPPDASHTYDAGHRGVLVTWAASWDGTQWIAQYGNQPFGVSLSGNGTPYVKAPTYTNGDSCWYYGLGSAYPSSGCDHFGVSFAYTATPGKISYHWKIPDPTSTGMLKNAALETALPPTPVLTQLPVNPGLPPLVRADAEAAENNSPDPTRQYGNAFWVKVTTYFAPQGAVLDDLQKANVKRAVQRKTVSWSLLQKPPIGKRGGRNRVDNHNVPNNAVQVTKQYEYFKYKGVYDHNHEALCGVMAANGATDCTAPYSKTYTATDPETGSAITALGGDKGPYLGAHVNAFNIQ
jgi:hypothetical protein